ncbi:FadR/GntR family transcriptional regulator [Marispirochaeta sp.]|jgi:GntR family transcriptional regulator, transcriptional repressor for pyruvate dehydrogenase complex|uniref:FadR/GntR family transcriptional regulator n=1 Tax=Marispirochaeta sp. TaxID=2038653 RepID=UPI0029C96847|nr:FadR/GntR family transcriptional regulator [Marispirochaeta sp.]
MTKKAGLEPIVKEPLKKALMKQLTRFIWNDLEDGDKLPTEKELSDQLQVGRSSIREALRSIEAMGLLEVHRGSGYYVTKKTGNLIRGPIELVLSQDTQPLFEIIEARAIFESALADLIIQRISDKEITEAEAAVQELKENVDNPDKALAADHRFHKILYEAVHNTVVFHIHDLVSQIIKNIPGSYLHSRDYTEDTYYFHDKMLQALRNRDGNALREAINAHNKWIYKVFKLEI